MLEVKVATVKVAMEATQPRGMQEVLLQPATVASKVMVSKVEMVIQEVTAVDIDQVLIISALHVSSFGHQYHIMRLILVCLVHICTLLTHVEYSFSTFSLSFLV
jgi:hypothetical protein